MAYIINSITMLLILIILWCSFKQQHSQIWKDALAKTIILNPQTISWNEGRMKGCMRLKHWEKLIITLTNVYVPQQIALATFLIAFFTLVP